MKLSATDWFIKHTFIKHTYCHELFCCLMAICSLLVTKTVVRKRRIVSVLSLYAYFSSSVPSKMNPSKKSCSEWPVLVLTISRCIQSVLNQARKSFILTGHAVVCSVKKTFNTSQLIFFPAVTCKAEYDRVFNSRIEVVNEA